MTNTKPCAAGVSDETTRAPGSARWFLKRSSRGATAVEYAIMLAAITAVIVATVTQLGTKVAGLFEIHW